MRNIMSLMHREINQQPSVLQEMFVKEAGTVRRVVEELRKRDPRYVVIAARGSSDNAARYAKYLFGSQLGLQVALATPSLFTIYGRFPSLRDSLVIGISQSGRPEDIVAVLAEARQQGVPTVAITNSPESPLAAQADHVLETHAGVERSVPATKTYTSQLAMLSLWAANWLQDPDLLSDLMKVPETIQRVLDLEPMIKEAALRYQLAEHCVVLGRGYNYATAFEIALKLKETCYLAAEPYSPADFQHGPVALIKEGFPAVVVAPSGAAFSDLYDFASELGRQGASITMISDRAEALALADSPLELPSRTAEWISPLVTVIPGQLLALHLALARGHDPDRPRGLQKVTITR
jgi:glucosamine--fructose-6-phosphate aminotransferase (isomerizing)